MKTLLALVLCLLPTLASATDWVWAWTMPDHKKIYFDPATVERTGDEVRVWVQERTPAGHIVLTLREALQCGKRLARAEYSVSTKFGVTDEVGSHCDAGAAPPSSL